MRAMDRRNPQPCAKSRRQRKSLRSGIGRVWEGKGEPQKSRVWSIERLMGRDGVKVEDSDGSPEMCHSGRPVLPVERRGVSEAG